MCGTSPVRLQLVNYNQAHDCLLRCHHYGNALHLALVPVALVTKLAFIAGSMQKSWQEGYRRTLLHAPSLMYGHRISLRWPI